MIYILLRDTPFQLLLILGILVKRTLVIQFAFALKTVKISASLEVWHVRPISKRTYTRMHVRTPLLNMLKSIQRFLCFDLKHVIYRAPANARANVNITLLANLCSNFILKLLSKQKDYYKHDCLHAYTLLWLKH